MMQYWNRLDIAALLHLEPDGEGRFVSTQSHANANGRCYGGQTLGQCLMAAAHGMPQERRPSVLQALFLQGALPDRPIEFQVETLQEGRRFSSRHVRASQQGHAVLDANIAFAVDLPASTHAAPFAWGHEDPHAGIRPTELLAGGYEVEQVSDYASSEMPTIELRIPAAESQLALATAGPDLRYWLRATGPLPDLAAPPHLHAAVFAFLSDYWLNFAALSQHRATLAADEQFYVSSLNHTIWFHRPVVADAWMHVNAHSPSAAHGRGMTHACVHNRTGQVVASLSQEALMTSIPRRPRTPTA